MLGQPGWRLACSGDPWGSFVLTGKPAFTFTDCTHITRCPFKHCRPDPASGAGSRPGAAAPEATASGVAAGELSPQSDHHLTHIMIIAPPAVRLLQQHAKHARAGRRNSAPCQ